MLVKVLGLVKTTLFKPADLEGEVQETDEDEINETEVQLVPPIVMVAPDTKSDPVSVTEVPPAVVPKVGVMLLKVGGTA